MTNRAAFEWGMVVGAMALALGMVTGILFFSCSSAESDSCKAALKQCRTHLKMCLKHNPTAPVWLGDVHPYENP